MNNLNRKNKTNLSINFIKDKKKEKEKEKNLKENLSNNNIQNHDLINNGNKTDKTIGKRGRTNI